MTDRNGIVPGLCCLTIFLQEVGHVLFFPIFKPLCRRESCRGTGGEEIIVIEEELFDWYVHAHRRWSGHPAEGWIEALTSRRSVSRGVKVL